MKKVVALTFAVILFSLNLFAFARASDYIDSYSIGISPQGGGVVKVSVSIQGTHPNMTKIGFPTISLYEWTGSEWKIVKVVNSQYTSSKGSHNYSFEYQGTAGKHYYSRASFYAEDTTGFDKREADSLSVKAT